MIVPMDPPAGFRYVPELVSASEELALIETVWVYFSFKRDEVVARRIDMISAIFMLTMIPFWCFLFFTVLKG